MYSYIHLSVLYHTIRYSCEYFLSVGAFVHVQSYTTYEYIYVDAHTYAHAYANKANEIM